MTLVVLNYLTITSGLFLAIWGLLHQLIVGAAVTMFGEMSEKEARLFIMSWVAQGAFMTFTGILTALLLAFHDLNEASSRTTLILTSIAMLVLGFHVVVSGYKTALKPVRVGAYLEILTGSLILVLVIINQFVF